MRMIRTPAIIAFATLLLTGSASGVVGQSEDGTVAGPVEFSGGISGGTLLRSAPEAMVDDHAEVRGISWSFSNVKMSDPRLEGTAIHTHNLDGYGSPSFTIFSSTWRIENEEGAWEGPEHSVILPDGRRTTATAILTGEGAYQGLTALVEVTFVGNAKEFDGVIVSGELPPIPAPLASE